MTKTHAQVKAIFALARAKGMNDDLLHETVASVTGGNPSIRELNFTNANNVIVRLGGKAFGERGMSRRNIQHRRKQAGVTQIAQPVQLFLMQSLADKRSWTTATLEGFCVRQCGHYPPRTTSDTSKVIEALKAMHRREAA